MKQLTIQNADIERYYGRWLKILLLLTTSEQSDDTSPNSIS